MRIAVIGGGGFIGSHVVARLRQDGHEVTVVDAVPPAEEHLPFIQADIRSYESVHEALRGQQAAFHLAAYADVNQVYARPVDAMLTNVVGTVNVLEAARQHKLQRVIVASTVWVYNQLTDPVITEETPLHPSGPGHLYSTSKAAADFACHDYQRLYQVPFTILRYGIPYGPGMRKELLIRKFITDAQETGVLTINGDGSQTRPFIYISDLAEAHALALAPEAENQVFNLPGPRNVSVREVAETVDQLFGNRLQVSFTASRPGDYKGNEQTISYAKAQRLLGWQPEVDLAQGIGLTYAWLGRAFALAGD